RRAGQTRSVRGRPAKSRRNLRRLACRRWKPRSPRLQSWENRPPRVPRRAAVRGHCGGRGHAFDAESLKFEISTTADGGQMRAGQIWECLRLVAVFIAEILGEVGFKLAI